MTRRWLAIAVLVALAIAAVAGVELVATPPASPPDPEIAASPALDPRVRDVPESADAELPPGPVLLR
jgi:hypothetical protein